MAQDIYHIEPRPSLEQLLEIAQLIKERGFSLQYDQGNVSCLIEAQRLIREIGPTAIMKRQMLTEEVLPDNTPTALLLQTLRYKLEQCAANTSLLLIDVYLFPAFSDTAARAAYVADLMTVLTRTLQRVQRLDIYVRTQRSTQTEAAFFQAVDAINPTIVKTTKYGNIFHDRFWVADETRGMFVGTSLNGIGKRYALVDYIQDSDTADIVARYNALP